MKKELGKQMLETRLALNLDETIVAWYVGLNPMDFEAFEMENADISVEKLEKLMALYGLRMNYAGDIIVVKEARELAKKMIARGFADTVTELQNIAALNRVIINQQVMSEILARNLKEDSQKEAKEEPQKKESGQYLLIDEGEGECWGEYDSVDEAVEGARYLKRRDYFVMLYTPEEHKIVVDIDEFRRMLDKKQTCEVAE